VSCLLQPPHLAYQVRARFGILVVKRRHRLSLQVLCQSRRIGGPHKKNGRPPTNVGGRQPKRVSTRRQHAVYDYALVLQQETEKRDHRSAVGIRGLCSAVLRGIYRFVGSVGRFVSSVLQLIAGFVQFLARFFNGPFVDIAAGEPEWKGE
jgi:hypothetical protein